MKSLVETAIALLALAATASAHGQEALKVPDGADWMTRHMIGTQLQPRFTAREEERNMGGAVMPAAARS